MSTIRPKKDAQTLNGYPISTDEPTSGDALVWNGTEWAPGAGGGGTAVPVNFSQTKGAQVTITAAEAKPATVVSATITTQGNPVQIIVSGDANPSAAGWGRINIYRGVTAVGQVVQFESSAGNENVPYSLEVVDEPAAGTWTYSLAVTSVTTDTQFGESAGPIITLVELGGVGSATPTGAAGGDLGGTYPNPDVVALQGNPVSSTAPSPGEVLGWDGSQWAPTVGGGGAAGGTNEIQYNDGTNVLTASSNLTFDSATNDFIVGSAALGHSIRIGPVGYVSNPIIESLYSMNINITDFGGALGIQTGNVDLVLIGGDDGSGESYLQTQDNVRLETKGRLVAQPATDSSTAVVIKQSPGAGGASLFEVDTSTPQITAYTRVSVLGGGQGLDINAYSVEYVGGAGFLIDSDSGLNLGTTTSTGVAIGSATSALTIAGAFTLPTTDGTSGDVLTTDGSGNVTWQAGGGGGGAAGGANEIQYNDGSNALTASANLTFDGSTLNVVGVGPIITAAEDISGQFLSINSTTWSIELNDPLTPTNTTTISPSDVAVSDSNQSANLSFGTVSVTDTSSTNTLALKIIGGTPVISSSDGVGAPAPLNLSIDELQLNGDAGSSGYVLTSNGAGAAPTWQAAQVNQQVYVAEGADTAVANGSALYPYATITDALTAITDASPTKRYAISVAGGSYNEGVSLNIKPNVFIVGAAAGAVRITATTFGMEASFSAGSGVDNRSGYQNVILIGSCNFDWSTVTSSAGKLYFMATTFNSAVTLNGYNNAIAQAQFTSCQFFGTFTSSGINVGVFANNLVFANIVLNQHSTLATVFQTAGGYCSGTMTATTTVNTFARRISIFARSFWMNAVTVDGPQTYLDYTVDSLPSAGATVLNGATLVSIDAGTGANKDLSNLNFPTAVNNPIIPATTSATNFGDWGFQWFWSFAYIHASTGEDCYLASYPSAFGAETGPGKNIYVFADAAGLAANVSGGIVGLYTNNATGTGASGLIEAETGTSANGDTGIIRFTTGTPSGTGRRGSVVINSPLTHPYGSIGVATPTAAVLRTNPTYLTSQAAITLPSMVAADDGLRIEIVSTAACVVTPPSGAANQRTTTARGGSTWIWIDGSSDWFCISNI